MVIGQTVANMAIFATFIIAAVRHLGLIQVKYFTVFLQTGDERHKYRGERQTFAKI